MKHFTQPSKKNFYIVTSMLMIATAITFFLTKPKYELQDDQNAQTPAAGLIQSSDLLMENPLMLVLTAGFWSSDISDPGKISEEK